MNRKIIYFMGGLALCIAVAWAVVALVRGHAPSRTVSESGAVVTGEAEIGGPFQLVDSRGATVTPADFRGSYMLIYFGFTFCPDICPTELASIAQAVDLMGKAGEKVVPVFITIDPERDTPEMMADYVRAFHPRMVGLTGTPEQVAQAAAAWKVYYRRAPGSAPAGGPGSDAYLMDHSSFIYLMGPDGDFRALFRGGTDAETLARTVTRIVESS